MTTYAIRAGTGNKGTRQRVLLYLSSTSLKDQTSHEGTKP